MQPIILGSGGQLGRALTKLLPTAEALTRRDLDLGDPDAVRSLDWSRYDTVINAAAYTSVDKAESADGRVAAWRVNATGVANLARAALRHDLTLVHVSSEYVFDGTAAGEVSENLPVCPLSAYGASKAAGDAVAALVPRHYVVRTAWVVGEGGNFVRTMLSLAERGVSPTVVADQIGRPSFAGDLANGMLALLEVGPEAGVYNLTNTGTPASWADLARATFELAGRDPHDVSDTTTAEYFADKPAAATRPLNSVLDLGKADALGIRLPRWQDSLSRYVGEEISR